MKNRKRGFSLVELLIVLAVIAALIATITPVALNAIKKSKATQVAQNLKTLASALENSAYVNGITPSNEIKDADGNAIEIEDLGREIDTKKYEMTYTLNNTGLVSATVTYKGHDVDADIVHEMLPLATGSTGGTITYAITFEVY